MVLAFSAAMFFAVAHAQEATELVPDTGEKPTTESEVVADPVEAKKPEVAEVKKPEAAEVKKAEVVEAKTLEGVENKTPEPVKEPSTVAVDGEETKKDEETAAKRAKPVNSETIRVFGWVEWCEISEKKLRMKARLDTGAKTSSLHAEDIELFERDGAKWVKFTTETSNGKSVIIERPLKRIARIRKAGSEKLDERYVVDLYFAIDGIQRRGEFTLTERDHMNYPVLVGRNLIGEFGLIDARRSFIAEEKIEL